MGAVFEKIRLAGGQHLLALQVIQIGIESDFAQGDDDIYFAQSSDFPIEKRRAVGKFLRHGLVRRWSTAHGGRNIKVLQLETVVAISGVGLVGKSGFIQHGIHEFAGCVAGEGTPGAVGAVSAGGESHDQHARIGIAEAGDWLTPILAIEISAAFHACDLLAIFDQARTARAGDNFAIKNGEPVRLSLGISRWLLARGLRRGVHRYDFTGDYRRLLGPRETC